MTDIDWHYTKWIYRNYARLWSDRYRADLARNVDGYPSLLPVISGPGSDRQTWNPTAWKAPGNINIWKCDGMGYMGYGMEAVTEYRNFMRKIEIYNDS